MAFKIKINIYNIFFYNNSTYVNIWYINERSFSNFSEKIRENVFFRKKIKNILKKSYT